MAEQLQHEMILEDTQTAGEEDWYCPICGRRMSITWHPWKKLIIDPGDAYASHSIRKGTLRLGPVQITQDEQVIDSSIDDPYLAPWQRWLDRINPDDLWNGGL